MTLRYEAGAGLRLRCEVHQRCQDSGNQRSGSRPRLTTILTSGSPLSSWLPATGSVEFTQSEYRKNRDRENIEAEQ